MKTLWTNTGEKIAKTRKAKNLKELLDIVRKELGNKKESNKEAERLAQLATKPRCT